MKDLHYCQKLRKKNVWHNIKAPLNWMDIPILSLWANSILPMGLTPAVRACC